MKQFVILTLVAVFFAAEARFSHPFSIDNIHGFLQTEMDSAGLDDGYGSAREYLPSGNQMYHEDLPKANPSHRRMTNKNFETKRTNPAVSPLLEQSPADIKHEELGSNDYFNNSIKKKMRKTQALNKLYEEIAMKFPFLVKQGLFDSGTSPSLDHLLSMTVFSQPKMGRK